MRVAVTGSEGLLGRAVMEALSQVGHVARGVDLVHGVDLRDADAAREALAGCEAVVHLAGYPRAGSLAPQEVFTTNTAIGFAVVQAAADLGMHRLVNASSVSVKGYPFFVRPMVPDALPLAEADSGRPQDAYGLSKAVLESIIDAAVARGALSAVSIRMPWLQTPDTFSGDIAASREDGMDARNLFAYLDTRDAAAALAAAVEVPVVGHRAVLIAAEDTFDERPTAQLIADAFPGVPVTGDLGAHASLIDSTAAHELLGVRPRYSWRDYSGPV